jgi:hypothetical protein
MDKKHSLALDSSSESESVPNSDTSMRKTSTSSGAAKRRKKKESVKGTLKLTAYFTRRDTADPEEASSSVPDEPNQNAVDFVTNATDDAARESIAETVGDQAILMNISIDEQFSKAEDVLDQESTVIQKHATDNQNDNMTLLTNLLQAKNPTDRGHFPEDMSDDGIKRFVVEHGSCRPPDPFPSQDDNTNVHFQNLTTS